MEELFFSIEYCGDSSLTPVVTRNLLHHTDSTYSQLKRSPAVHVALRFRGLSCCNSVIEQMGAMMRTLCLQLGSTVW
jgi:hypothetical protein